MSWRYAAAATALSGVAAAVFLNFAVPAWAANIPAQRIEVMAAKFAFGPKEIRVKKVSESPSC